MSPDDLKRETQAAKVLLAQLADIIGDDEQAKADAIEGETNLLEAVSNAIELLTEDSAAIVGLDDMIKKLTARRERIGTRIANTRTALAAALEQAGRNTFHHPCATLSVKNTPPKAIITDETILPTRYWKMEPKLDKRAILDDLKDEKNIPGACLSNGGSTLQVRFT